MGELGKLPLADLTPVRFDPEMDPRVLGQVGTVRERFATARALVGLGFSQVELGMELEVSFAGERLNKQKFSFISRIFCLRSRENRQRKDNLAVTHVVNSGCNRYVFMYRFQSGNAGFS